MIGNAKDEEGKLKEGVNVSLYNPSQEIKDLLANVKEDYFICYQNLHNTYPEFNDLSVVGIMNRDQKIFNEYIAPPSEDQRESWKADTIRPLTRNKVISIAAHILARIIYPDVYAQNDQDEEDKLAAQIMGDLLEWVIDDEKTDYKVSFLYSIIGALVNPVSYIKVEFVEALQEIKKKTKEGRIERIKVIDDVLSGIHVNVLPSDEVMIYNPYEYNIQRQKCVIRRRFIDYTTAEALYGTHPDFNHVTPGISVFYSDDDGTFYEQKDDENPNLVEEVTYYNRRADTQLTLINGILVSDREQRIKHRTNKDRPRYEFVKFGYETIDEKKFFYYKSLVSKLWHQQRTIDRMWNMVMDGTFLDIMPPVNIFGEGEVGTGVIVPGAVNYFGEDAQMQPYKAGGNLNAGINALGLIDSAASESSQDAIRQGVTSSGSRTAREVILAEQNASIQLGLFGAMVASAIRQLGDLLIDLIIQHMTVGQVEEITAGEVRMKFRNFILPDKLKDGRKITKRLIFTDEFNNLEEPLTEEDMLKESFKLFNQGGKLEAKTAIYKINPIAFANLKFMTRVGVDNIGPKNEELDKALKSEAYDKMIENPYIDPIAVTRDFLVGPHADGEIEKYMRKASELGIAPNLQAPQAGKVNNQVTSATTSLKNLTNA